jgi:hypothetical protein
MNDWTQRAKRYHDAIHSVLLKEWDPIGVADIPEAHDEYDAYVAGVYKRLISRASEEDLFTYLWDIETEYMGLYGNSGHTRAIAKRLLELIAFIEQEQTSS